MNPRVIEVLAEANRWVNTQPHIPYGTQFDRFGIQVPPNPRHADCSGATHSWYRHVHVECGYDTGDMWRDIGRGRCRRVSPVDAAPGDLLLYKNHSGGYRSGPSEHVGMKVRNEGDRIRTYESAGGGKGLCYITRAAGWWDDGLHYHAMDLGGTVTPLPKLEDEMFRIIKGDKESAWWLTNWETKRHVKSKDEADAIRKAGITNGAAHPGVWPQVWVDNIPEVK